MTCVFHVERAFSAFHVEHAARIPVDHVRDGLRELGFGEPQVERMTPILSALASLVLDWSARVNLTGHRTPTAVVDQLVLDAVSVSRLLPDPCPTFVDLGSGAGFPGLPVAIVRPGTAVSLVESRAKRHHFHRAAIRHLALQNVSSLLGRSEDLRPQLHAAGAAFGVGPALEALDLLCQWVEPGGILLASRRADERSRIETAEFEADPAYYRGTHGVQRPVWIGRRRPCVEAPPAM